MFHLFDFATNNLHLMTIFYHLVANWRLKDFVNFEPCFNGILPFWGVLTPLLGFRAKIQRKERFSVKFMVKSLVENYLFMTKLLAKTHEMA